jgi:hypothetical protein
MQPHKYEFNVTEGSLQASCSAFYGKSYGSSSCYTYRPILTSNDRWIGITFFDRKSKKAIHQVDAYSAGAVNSVLRVALEMCYAGLEDFPQRFEKRNYAVSWNLEKEGRGPASE